MRGREFWVSKVAEYERSELTQESFAQQRGIAVSTLRWWISKLRQERRSSVSLVPVRVIPSTAPTARSTADADREIEIEIEIELKTGVRLRVTTDADLDYVVALAQRLG